jgi:glycosyltransferase involved in cell wall biosynthesis
MFMKKAIVNICTYKRPAMLQRCLDSILQQNIPSGWDVEILIVDNEASSNLLNVLDSKIQESSINIIYVIETQLGIPYARNTACRESMNRKADWILFLDDDEEADPGWLEAYQKASETTEADVYTGPVRYIFPAGYAEWLENKGISKTSDGSLLKRASTNNVMFSSGLLMNPQTRLEFDTNMAFTGGSDSDFFMRVVHQGGRIVYVKDAVVSEVVLDNRLQLFWRLKRQYRSSANRIYIQIKLYGFKKTLITSLKEFARHLIEGSLRLVTSPLFLVVGQVKFKRSYYHGVRHFSKAAGIIAGLFGKHPQPYKKIDGF